MRRPIRQRGSAMSRKHGGEVSSGKAFSRNFTQTEFYEVRLTIILGSSYTRCCIAGGP
jgi:hypothetical protein